MNNGLAHVLSKLTTAREAVVQAGNALSTLDNDSLDNALAAVNTATDLLDEATEQVKKGINPPTQTVPPL